MTASLLLAACLTFLGTCQHPSTTGGAATAPVVERLDAAAFFERLVARYRELALYRDLTSVVQIMREAPGSPDETQRTETRMICEVLDGELRIVTPGSQLRDALAKSIELSVSVRDAQDESGERVVEGDGTGEEPAGEVAAEPDPAVAPRHRGIEGSRHRVGRSRESLDALMPCCLDPSAQDTHGPLNPAALAHRYRLWLAPHLTLKFSEEPLSDFRASARQPLTPTEASAVTIEDRVMVHVELKSGRASAGHDAPDDFDAKFDLYINPESMLIERIEGRERLPDGGRIETTYTIQPIIATEMDAGAEPIAPDGNDEEEPAAVEEEIEPTIGGVPTYGGAGL